jgi:hypothetical protein
MARRSAGAALDVLGSVRRAASSRSWLYHSMNQRDRLGEVNPRSRATGPSLDVPQHPRRRPTQGAMGPIASPFGDNCGVRRDAPSAHAFQPERTDLPHTRAAGTRSHSELRGTLMTRPSHPPRPSATGPSGGAPTGWPIRPEARCLSPRRRALPLTDPPVLMLVKDLSHHEAWAHTQRPGVLVVTSSDPVEAPSRSSDGGFRPSDVDRWGGGRPPARPSPAQPRH